MVAKILHQLVSLGNFETLKMMELWEKNIPLVDFASTAALTMSSSQEFFGGMRP